MCSTGVTGEKESMWTMRIADPGPRSHRPQCGRRESNFLADR